MRNDLHKTFGEITGDYGALHRQMCEVQLHDSDREKALEWSDDLRFLDISQRNEKCPIYSDTGRDTVVQHHTKPQVVIPIVQESTTFKNVKPSYMAVTWRWIADSGNGTSNYHIRRPCGLAYKSEFPDQHMDRVIRFAEDVGIDYIWIDKDCIFQREGDGEGDGELGVQVMDMVYQNAHFAAGLLTIPPLEQDEVESLATLLQKGYSGELSLHSLREHFDRTAKWRNVVQKIMSDKRWKRAWIFQEDHLASDRMHLLVPCARFRRRAALTDMFGNIPGDLVIKLMKFKKAMTALCNALPNYNTYASLRQDLEGVKYYKTANRETLIVTALSHRLESNSYPTTTASVILDMITRDLAKYHDRIPLAANLLQCAKRLDVKKTSPLITSNRFSLSIVLLALVLLNGEILLSDQVLQQDIMKHTLHSYLKDFQLRIIPPDEEQGQVYVDSCRFRNPTFGARGIEVQGDLLKVWTLACRQWDSKGTLSTTRRCHQILSPLQKVVLKHIIDELDDTWKGCPLVRYLELHLAVDRASRPRCDLPLSQVSVLKRLSAVTKALIAHRTVYTAGLTSQCDKDPPAAIVVEPGACHWSTGRRQGSSLVHNTQVYSRNEPIDIFVSLIRDREEPRRRGRLAMLRVEGTDSRRKGHTGRISDYVPLRACSWVDGVFCTLGKKNNTFVFYLPGSAAPSGMDRGRKRKSSGSSND